MPSNTTKLTVFAKPSFATVLLAAFVDRYGLAIVAGDDNERWEAETIGLELEQDIGEVDPENLDKLMTAIELLTTDSFETSLPDFIRICNSLAGSPTDGGFDPAEPHEMAWALLEAGLIRGTQAFQYNPEIVGYAIEMLKDEGLLRVPDALTTLVPRDALLGEPSRISDDPAMYEGLEETQSGNLGEIESFVTARFQSLLNGLAAISPDHLKENGAWVVELLREMQAA